MYWNRNALISQNTKKLLRECSHQKETFDCDLSDCSTESSAATYVAWRIGCIMPTLVLFFKALFFFCVYPWEQADSSDYSAFCQEAQHCKTNAYIARILSKKQNKRKSRNGEKQGSVCHGTEQWEVACKSFKRQGWRNWLRLIGLESVGRWQ